MDIESEVNQEKKEINRKIEALTTATIKKSSIILSKNTKIYRLQKGEYNGNGVFFNTVGEFSRYGLNNGVKGSLYSAFTPRTSIKEVFKANPFISRDDLNTYYMGTLVTEQDLTIVDITKLLPKTHITTHQLTSCDYTITQKLAKKLAENADGFIFLSNVTSEKCLVLWHDDISSETSIVRTEKLTVFSKFKFKGKIAEDILVEDLDISVL